MKKIVLFTTEDCEWCGEIADVLRSLDIRHVHLDIHKNNLAKGMAKKVCGGAHPCIMINNKIMRKIDKNQLHDEILK